MFMVLVSLNDNNRVAIFLKVLFYLLNFCMLSFSFGSFSLSIVHE